MFSENSLENLLTMTDDDGLQSNGNSSYCLCHSEVKKRRNMTVLLS